MATTTTSYSGGGGGGGGGGEGTYGIQAYGYGVSFPTKGLGSETKAVAAALAQLARFQRAQWLATMRANAMQLAFLTRPGSGLVATLFGSPRDETRVTLARAKLAEIKSRRYPLPMGDKTPKKVPPPNEPAWVTQVFHPPIGAKAEAKAEKALAKAEAKRDEGASVVFSASYGLNNPVIAGSRDDPAGFRRPLWRKSLRRRQAWVPRSPAFLLPI